MTALYEDLRPLMFSIAYRMLGSASDAEDIVQEAFLRLHRESEKGTVIESPKAYLSAVTTRLAIDHLRSARVRRERYVGTWLPEPVLTDHLEPDASEHAETADSLSMAFLVLLESLSPVERAVFLLREVFEYGYDEIAEGRGEDRGQLPADRGPRPQAGRGTQAAVRGIPATAGGAGPAILRGGDERRHLGDFSSCCRRTSCCTRTGEAGRRRSHVRSTDGSGPRAC